MSPLRKVLRTILGISLLFVVLGGVDYWGKRLIGDSYFAGIGLIYGGWVLYEFGTDSKEFDSKSNKPKCEKRRELFDEYEKICDLINTNIMKIKEMENTVGECSDMQIVAEALQEIASIERSLPALYNERSYLKESIIDLEYKRPSLFFGKHN